MRCDWTGIEPVVFRVAAQIFTIRPKLNLIIPSLIFGPTNLEVELWARIQSPHLKLVGMGTSVDARPRSSANRWNWTVFTSGVLHSGPPRCDADILITVCKVTLFFFFLLFLQSRSETTSTTTTPSLWMEITLYSNLRSVHYRQIKIHMEGSLSQYFGRPTKSILVQINMQQQHSLAPFGFLRLNKITKCFSVSDGLTNNALLHFTSLFFFSPHQTTKANQHTMLEGVCLVK